MRPALLAAVFVSCSAAGASAAGCEFDLAAVRESALAAGPVRTVEHFIEFDGASTRSLTVVIDLIRPDRLRRISIFEDGKVAHMVLIAGSGWSGNIERKWEPLNVEFVTKMLEAVMQNSPWPTSSAEATCEHVSFGNGEAALKFSFSTTSGEQSSTHEVLADQATKRPLRYRARTSTKGAPYTEIDRTFQFIRTLEIEAPK